MLRLRLLPTCPLLAALALMAMHAAVFMEGLAVPAEALSLSACLRPTPTASVGPPELPMPRRAACRCYTGMCCRCFSCSDILGIVSGVGQDMQVRRRVLQLTSACIAVQMQRRR